MNTTAPRSLSSRRKLAALLLGSLSLPLLTPGLFAASGTWSQSTAGTALWSDFANWSGGTIAGATSGTTSSDTATFNAGANDITIDSGRNLRTLTFDTTAGAFTLGSAGANAGNTLILSASGAVQVASTFAGTATKQTINAPLQLMGATSFTNSSNEYSNTLNFAGNISAGTSSAVGLTLNGNNNGDNVISAVIGNGSSSALSITKSNSGTWTLSGANTYTGTTTVTGGVLKVTSDASLGTAPGSTTGGSIVLSAAVATTPILSTGASFTLNSNRGITLGSATASSGGTISVTDGATLTYGGVIAGGGTSNNFYKTGNGTLALSGTNTYGGSTQIAQGTLKLDFSAGGAPTNNILASGGALVLGAGLASSNTLAITGSGTNTQTLGAVSYSVGSSHINLTPGSGTLTLALGALNSHSTGQTLDISLPSNAVVTTTSSNTNMTGSLVPMVNSVVTINGTDFATINGSSQIVALSSGSYTANTASSLGSGGAIVDMTTAATTQSSNVTLGDLRFNTPQATTITLASGVALNIGGGNAVPGMILVTSNMGSNNALITGNGMLGGISARDFVVVQNNTYGYLQIDPTINDFNNNTSGFTKAGAGKVILTGTNAYQGTNYINEGTVVVTGDVKAASSQTLTTGTTSTITVTDASNLFVGERVSGSGITSGTYIKAISGNTVTLTANTTAATGTVNFLGGGALGINTSGTSSGSQVQVGNGATLQIGNGGTTGTLFTGQAITNYGTVALNRSDDFTFSNVITNNHAGNTMGAGALNKMASNTASIDVLNSYSGATTISGGTLSVGGGSTASASSLAGSTTNGSNVITGLSSTAGLVVGQSVTGTGIPAGAVITAINSGTSVTISINPTSSASNTYTFYSGSPLANGGVSSAIGRSSSDAANLVLDSGTLKYTGAAASTDRLFTVTQNGGGLDASGASNAAVNFTNTGAVAFSGSGARTLALSGSSTGDNTLSAVIGNGTGGATSLTKSGAGKWVLNGANTYTGNTTISGGTLALGATGTFANSPVINLGTVGSQGTLDLTAKTGGFSIASGQTLSGFGTVNIGGTGHLLTIASGATLAPGNSPGIVNITGDLALASGSFTNMEVAGTATDGNASNGFDRVIVSGSMTLGGTLNITAYNGYGLGATSASYDLFDFTAKSGTFNLVTVAGTSLTASSGVWTATVGNYGYNFDESSGILTVSSSQIPETATYAVLLGSLALCGAGLRRRSRCA